MYDNSQIDLLLYPHFDGLCNVIIKTSLFA